MSDVAPRIWVRRIHADAQMPQRMSTHAAGLDIAACLEVGQTLRLEPSARVLVPTGLQIAVPYGYEAQIRPRSGLALHHGVTIPNAPGTIDADYRGELKVIMINSSGTAYEIRHGERIAQLVVAAVAMVDPEEVDTLPPPQSDRGTGGFGSTGR